ncbi:hypothetical protein HPB48_026446 [Haemaphysalis longicornis]|uniref:Uncharacterized protein n=1 Tax=Haemaphysalis longicornis TaxID=44386 RepID=A0A9J6H157_HAELO|nr:hypothetical protein HPB48_026446 [Haemaphysalis longicornis]
MTVDKFGYIMRSTTDARCVLDVSRHLWLEEATAQRSLTGRAPRTISGASGKCVATPEKVDIVKSPVEHLSSRAFCSRRGITSSPGNMRVQMSPRIFFLLL